MNTIILIWTILCLLFSSNNGTVDWYYRNNHYCIAKIDRNIGMYKNGTQSRYYKLWGR